MDVSRVSRAAAHDVNARATTYHGRREAFYTRRLRKGRAFDAGIRASVIEARVSATIGLSPSMDCRLTDAVRLYEET
jgi:hypothetical protein